MFLRSTTKLSYALTALFLVLLLSSCMEIGVVDNSRSADAQQTRLSTLQLAARHNDRVAQYLLALRYLSGNGIKQSHKKGLQWLRRSAENRYPKAMYRLAETLESGIHGDHDQAAAEIWYRRAAEERHTQAMHWMAKYQAETRGDMTASAHWYDLASKQGHDESQFALGIMYQNGVGVAKNHELARQWLSAAAEQGYPGADEALEKLAPLAGKAGSQAEEAQTEVEEISEDRGNVVAVTQPAQPVDIEEKIPSTDDAGEVQVPVSEAEITDVDGAESGLSREQEADSLFQRGLQLLETPESHGAEEAVLLIRKAADAGHSGAQYQLGYIYSQGDLVERDIRSTVRYWSEASDAGFHHAQMALGILYVTGDGVELDQQKAIELWRMAARQGNAGAMYNLGQVYEEGHGVEIDEIRALSWYLISLHMDYSVAEERKNQLVSRLDEARQFESAQIAAGWIRKWLVIAAD